MSDKRGDRYYGMSLRRQGKLTKEGNRFHTMCLEVETSADEIMKIANELGNKKLIAEANKLLFASLSNQGWIEG